MSTLNGGPGNIVTNGLILYADVANPSSYVSGSLIVNSLVDTLTGSFDIRPGYTSSNAGTIYFNEAPILTFLTSSEFNTIQTNNALTLSVWFTSPTTSSYRDVIGINKTVGNNPFTIRINNSNRLFYDTTIGGTRFTPGINETMPTNTWIHACATFQNNLITTYYNGRSVNSQATSGSIAAFTSNQFSIGSSLGYGYFLGNISNFQLYNRALSAAEVLQNYNAQKTRFGL